MARTEKVEVYLTKAELANAKRCAKAADLSVSEWGRDQFKNDSRWKKEETIAPDKL
jgi:hypothetical protein